LIAKAGDKEEFILPKMANRHGVITGATGTGKTVTLQAMAQSFSRIGVPVFMADVKGDLSGVSQPGSEGNARVTARVEQLGLKDGWAWESCPVTFWDVWGEQGHPLRATISEMGPVLLSRVLNLNDTQEGVFNIVFKVADDNGLLLLDLKDMRSMVQWVGDNARTLITEYGNISAASIGAIQRGLLTLDSQGADKFFGEPALDLMDMIQTDASGKGVINILAADKLLQAPKLYATFLLWLMSELFENLPEAGDVDKPKLVFFFDEAHLLFDEAPDALLQKIEQVVRLIRSKGVGVYFCTQNPIDVPDKILGQMGNRVQHTLRAFTPRDQKAVRAAAETFRLNPNLNVEQAITELGVGEALVSFLDEKGMPNIVERTFIIPPRSQIGPITPEQRSQIIKSSLVFDHYQEQLDRESAYEVLKQKTADAAKAAEEEKAVAEQDKLANQQAKEQAKVEATQAKEAARLEAFKQKEAEKARIAEEKASAKQARQQQDAVGDMADAFGKSMVRAAGVAVGATITRGILGSLFGGSSSRKRQ
jgi:DNA helicase HerA-like ATPase